ncbi:hypothetical protein RISK_003758 [Rhodopirellula islandica]|uniref:Uncharacterized protein n=1 Tax=Rhodopirellula islandica TaxID=595434 RepID=A0A0J1BC29_RHOIS|nr:hypothetical protein RISK_003758 [Rhodopirellula islandica]
MPIANRRPHPTVRHANKTEKAHFNTASSVEWAFDSQKGNLLPISR